MRFASLFFVLVFCLGTSAVSVNHDKPSIQRTKESSVDDAQTESSPEHPSLDELSIQVVGNDLYGHPKRPLAAAGRTGIRIVDSESHFHVVLTNGSGQPIRLWEKWNSLGYYNLSFDLLDADGKLIGEMNKLPKAWGKNYPSFLVLKPNQHHVIDVYLNPELWSVPIKPIPAKNRSKQCSLIVKYSVEETPAANKNEVSCGTLRSEPIDINLNYRYRPKPK